MMGSDLTGRFHILNNDAIQTRANSSQPGPGIERGGEAVGAAPVSAT